MVNIEKNSFLFEDEKPESEKTGKQKIISGVFEFLFYLTLFVIVTLLFFVVKPNNQLITNGAIPKMIAVVLIGFVATVTVSYAVFGKLDRKTTVYTLFMVGIILRVCYMLYTPVSTRQHDVFTSSLSGHEAYAWTIFTTGKLPESNYYQFYHPPFNATMQALFMKFIQWLTDGLTQIFNLGTYFPDKFLQGYKSARLPDGSEYRYFLFSTTQILSVVYSAITVVYMLKIIRLFNFKGKTSVLVSAIVILFPRLIQFSTMVNNDAPSFMFSVLAVYFALKWQKRGKKVWNILLCSLACGFGMMSKLATATICLPIGGIFIYEFVILIKKFVADKKSGEKIKFSNYIGLPCQYVAFLLICAPLALWFQVYVNIRFDQGFGFVFNNLNQRLSTTHHSLFERLFFTFDLSEYFGQIYCSPFYDVDASGNIISYNNYNLFNYSLRSALFGEFFYTGGEGFAVLCIVFAYAFCIILAIALVKCLLVFIKSKKGESQVNKGGSIIDFKDFIFLFLLVQSQVLPEMFFYVKMPYACTMDFRYIMPIIPAIAIITGVSMKVLKEEGSAFAINLNKALTLSIIALFTCTTLFYCVAG